MTISKGVNQEVQGKTRTTTNALNPDAPEFNPRSRSTGKLNADAPEFVPGQYPVYDPLMFNMPEIKGYKNGHMQTYTLSHQDQVVPVWLSQSYSVDVPFQQLCNNQSLGFFPCDFTQTQNYPIQRNVYKNQTQGEYHVNTPYNVVVHGKTKVQKPKVGKPQKEQGKEKDNMSTGRDSVSVATTKDTSREYPPQPKEKPEQEMTWAERTKRSNAQQKQKQVIHTTQQITVPSKEQGKQKEKKTQLADQAAEGAKVNDSSNESDKKEEEEEVSYAKVFKEAVRSKANVPKQQEKGTVVKSEQEQKLSVKEDRVGVVKKEDTKSSVVKSELEQNTSFKREEDKVNAVTREVEKLNLGSSEPTKATVLKEDHQKVTLPKEHPKGHTSKEEAKLTVLKDQQRGTSLKEENVGASKKEERMVNKVTFAPTPKEGSSMEEKETYKLSESTSTDSEFEAKEGAAGGYSVEIMLGYYVYILNNRKMVDQIREKYKLPKISFGTVQWMNSSNSGGSGNNNNSNSMNKGNYKENDRHKDRSDKQDKKDWRHKNYDKNFGNNFRFSNKDFSRASNEFVPTIMSSESSWVIKQAKQKSDKEALFKRKIMGLLNRLTFEKFDIIFNQIIECGIDTPEHAEMLVRFVFGKAVTQHHFIPMYVELCAKLSRELSTIGTPNPSNSSNNTNNVNNNTNNFNDNTDTNVNNTDNNANNTINVTNKVNNVKEEEVPGNVVNNATTSTPSGASGGTDSNVTSNGVEVKDGSAVGRDGTTNGTTKEGKEEPVETTKNKKSDFMRILLNCSQDSFEDNLKPLETPSELEGDDKFEYEQRYKHRMRGNMIFVGELFKQKLLAAKLLITCLDQVFMKREECIALSDDVNTGNNHLEAVCTLLQTVGRSFDTKRWKHAPELEKRIQHLADLGENELISFRIRCLIKNVLDNRLEHWDKSIYQKEEQPCKLQELRLKHITSLPSMTGCQAKPEKTEKEEMWRMRNKKKNSLSNLNRMDKSRKEIMRSFSKDALPEKAPDNLNYNGTTSTNENTNENNASNDNSNYNNSSNDENNDFDTNNNTNKDQKEEIEKNMRSIVRELVLSHDSEEASLRVDELGLRTDRWPEAFRLLVVNFLELCSKVNAERESELITAWIVALAREKGTLNALVAGLHEFVTGEEEQSMGVMVDDLPLLPRTLGLLVDKMRPDCGDDAQFQEVLTHI